MKKHLTFIMLLLLTGFFTPSLLSQEYQSWKYMHPKPQANLLRRIKMFNENTWYAIGANGTFMKTTDAGVNWYFHHQVGYTGSAQSKGSVSSQWFFDQNNGFVAGESGYIGKTTDGGVTFNAVGAGIIPTNEMGQGIWFTNQDTGFVTTRQGSWVNGRIVRTTDGGNTWTTVQTYSQGITAIYGTNSTTLYAVAVDGTIFKTTDCGNTWSLSIGAVGQYLYGMAWLSETTGFTAGSEGQIYRTTNAGLTWASVGSPQTEWAFYEFKIVSASEIYIVGDPVYLYKSTDLGETWQSLPIMPVNGPASTYIWEGVDKFGSTLLVCGDFGVVAKSIDGGLSWSANHFSLNTNIIFDLKQVPGTSNLIAVGRQYSSGTRQVYFSTDYGTHWEARDLGINFNASAVCMVNSQVGYLSGTNCIVMKTTNGGQTWFSVTQPVSGTYDLHNVDFVNPDTGWVFINYVGIPGGNIFKTINGGQSWTQQSTPGGYSIYSADMVNGSTGYLTINSSGQPIYKTTDGGNNWFAVTTPLIGNINSVKAVDANTVYIGSNFGSVRMAKSTNGGTSWIPLSLPASIDICSIDFIDSDTGYVCGNSTTAVCRTTNGGSSWTLENVHLPTLGKVAVIQNDVAFVLGTYGSILRFDPHGVVPVELLSFTSSVSGNSVTLSWSTATETNNRGFEVERSSGTSEWEKIGFVAGNSTTTEVRSFTYTDNEVNPGKYLYRLKQIDFDGTFKYYDAVEASVSLPYNYALNQNYPNPFNPSTTISYSVPQSSLVTLKVYNIIGQEVAQLVNEVKPAGEYRMSFDGSGLASGTYLVKMQAGEYSSTIKMTLMK